MHLRQITSYLLLAILVACTSVSPRGEDAEAWDQRPPEPLLANQVCDSLTPPEVRVAVPPVYPPVLRRERVQGDVLLTIVVDSNGQARDAVVAHSPDPDLTRSCVSALLAQRYSPAVCDGRPVSVRWSTSCRFRLEP